MARQLSVLDRVLVASPCPAAWKDMRGDERVRHCKLCNLNVYNLSELSRAEAEALIQSATGRLCIAYYQRADGTILTDDCPVGLRRARKAIIRGVAAIAAAFIFVAVAGLLCGHQP